MIAESKITVTVEQSSLRLGCLFLPEDFFKGGLKLSYSSACNIDGTGNAFVLITDVFQCSEVRCIWLLVTCSYCIMNPLYQEPVFLCLFR